jgi:signal peptidase
VSATAPDPGDQTTLAVTEHRYLYLLPAPVIRALHEISPTLTLGAVNAVLVGGTLFVLGRIVGFGTIRVRDSGNASLRTRLRRRFG